MTPEQWRLAYEALAALVREEYPDRSLEEIVATWGPSNLTPAHRSAVMCAELARSGLGLSAEDGPDTQCTASRQPPRTHPGPAARDAQRANPDTR